MHPKAVAIELDGQTRHLLYDLNALCLLRERHGINILKLDDADILDPVAVRAMLWAGLVHEDPTLTVEQVGVIDMGNLGALTEHMMRAIQVSSAAEVPAPVADPTETMGAN